MKRLSILILTTFVLFSCKKNTDDEIVGTYIWAPNIYADLGDKSAVLNLSDPTPHTLYAAPGPENPDHFEVLISEDQENFELYQRLDDFAETLTINDLVNGRDYYFKVIAYRNGFDSAASNMVMTIPAEAPKLEAYALGTDLSVQGLSLSPDLSYMTFYSNDYLSGERTSDLLVMDKSTGDVRSLGYSSYSANWSNTGNRLAYISTKLVGNTLYGDKVNIFNATTQETNELFIVDYEKYIVDLPIFRSGDVTISFLSSEGNPEIYNYDLWSIDLLTNEKTKLADFDALSFNATAYDWASSGNEIYIGGSRDLDEYVENIFSYSLDTKELVPVIESRWRDSRPSLSPDDSKLAFMSNRAGYFNEDIWVFNFETSAYKRLTGNGQQRRFFSTTSNLSWVDNNHILVTINNLDNTKQEAYTIYVQ